MPSFSACLPYLSCAVAEALCLRSLDRRDRCTIGKGAPSVCPACVCSSACSRAPRSSCLGRPCVYSFVAGCLSAAASTHSCSTDGSVRGRPVVFALAPVVRAPPDTWADDSAPFPGCLSVGGCAYVDCVLTLLYRVVLRAKFLCSMQNVSLTLLMKNVTYLPEQRVLRREREASVFLYL